MSGLLTAGCSAVGDTAPRPGGSPPGSRPPSAALGPAPDDSSVSCAHDLGGTVPDAGAYRMVLDAVALPAATLEPHESGEPGWLFAKQGLVVRAGTAVQISVETEWAAGARIGWGSPARASTTISVPACPGGASGWLAFAGGYTVRKPACVPLIVRVDGREERAGVGVGVAC